MQIEKGAIKISSTWAVGLEMKFQWWNEFLLLYILDSVYLACIPINAKSWKSLVWPHRVQGSIGVVMSTDSTFYRTVQGNATYYFICKWKLFKSSFNIYSDQWKWQQQR